MSDTKMCIDCGQDEGTLDGRCRDCDISYIVWSGSCRECGTWIMDVNAAGFAPKPVREQHKAECSLKDDREYWARTPDELERVKKLRGYG
jgi:predicted ATP-dependent serine protease